MSLPQKTLEIAIQLYSSPFETAERERLQRIFPEAFRYSIERIVHGMQHAARTTIFSRIFVNLLNISGEKINKVDADLIAIAACLHDAGRKAEGVDKWDRDSAEIIYKHLTDDLNYEPQQAKFIAEAMRNKDAVENGPFECIDKTHPTIVWKTDKYDEKKQGLYRNYIDCIQSADCLDIIRARDVFDIRYLKVYKRLANNHPDKHDDLLKILAYLKVQVMALLNRQGDCYRALDFKKKYKVENAEDPIEATCQLISSDPIFYTLQALLAPEEKSINSFESLIETLEQCQTELLAQSCSSSQNLVDMISKSKLYYRGIANPFVEKAPGKTALDIELEKLQRIGGNPHRAVSLMLFGMDAFAPVGLGFNIDDSEILHVSSLPTTSGYGKRMDCAFFQTPAEINDAKKSLLFHLLSGDHVTYKSMPLIGYNYNEITANLKLSGLAAVIVTAGRVKYNSNVPQYANQIIGHFIQQRLEKIGINVPLIVYNQNGFVFRKIDFAEENLKNFWEAYLKHESEKYPESFSIGFIRELLKRVSTVYSEHLRDELQKLYEECELAAGERARNIVLGVSTFVYSDVYKCHLINPAACKLIDLLKGSAIEEKIIRDFITLRTYSDGEIDMLAMAIVADKIRILTNNVLIKAIFAALDTNPISYFDAFSYLLGKIDKTAYQDQINSFCAKLFLAAYKAQELLPKIYEFIIGAVGTEYYTFEERQKLYTHTHTLLPDAPELVLKYALIELRNNIEIDFQQVFADAVRSFRMSFQGDKLVYRSDINVFDEQLDSCKKLLTFMSTREYLLASENLKLALIELLNFRKKPYLPRSYKLKYLAVTLELLYLQNEQVFRGFLDSFKDELSKIAEEFTYHEHKVSSQSLSSSGGFQEASDACLNIIVAVNNNYYGFIVKYPEVFESIDVCSLEGINSFLNAPEFQEGTNRYPAYARLKRKIIDYLQQHEAKIIKVLTNVDNNLLSDIQSIIKSASHKPTKPTLYSEPQRVSDTKRLVFVREVSTSEQQRFKFFPSLSVSADNDSLQVLPNAGITKHLGGTL